MDFDALETVVFCIDTNLLVEFSSLQQLNWRELVPSAENIRIIIPTKVSEEMDEHKNKNGRLRRRGIEFGQLARIIENAPNETLIISEVNPRVTVEFGPLFRKSELDTDQFELDDPDNRIVAETLKIHKSNTNVVFLSDDSKPIRLARQCGVSTLRPLAAWRRKEGPDERDIEIAELKNEIGAQPDLKLSIFGHNEKFITIEGSLNGTENSCAAAFSQTVLETEQQIGRQALIANHGLYSPTRFELGAGLAMTQGLSASQLDQYEQEYLQFHDRTQQIAGRLHDIFSSFGFCKYVEIEVGNAGQRAGEKVLLEAELQGNFRFLPVNIVSKLFKTALDVPSAPKPEKGLYHVPIHNLNLKDSLSSPRVDRFQSIEQPELNEDSHILSWRCDELRQGKYFQLPILIGTKSANESGLLKISLGGALTAKTTTLNVRIETRKMDKAVGADYFLGNLKLLPKKYRKSFKSKLQELQRKSD